jgi:hypothetical protein
MLKFTLIAISALILFACKPVTIQPIIEKKEKQILTINNNENKSEIEGESESATTELTKTRLPSSAFNIVEWTDLIPEKELNAYINPPDYIDDIEDGSLADQLGSNIQNSTLSIKEDSYQQALISTNIIEEMDGKAIKIPGFIVPLEFDDNQTVTQFFLVPYFGACIHMPPPPPNQIIFINYPLGLTVDSIYEAFWISGVLSTSIVENEISKAAYTMEMQSFEIYNEE